MTTFIKDYIAPWASVGLGLKDIWDGAKNIKQLWSHKRGVERVTRDITATTQRTAAQFSEAQASLESASRSMGRSVYMQVVGSLTTMVAGACNAFNALNTFTNNVRAAQKELTQQEKDDQVTTVETAYIAVAVSEGVNGLVHAASFITGTIAYCKSESAAETEFNKKVAINEFIQALASFAKSGGAIASLCTKNPDYSIATGVLGGGVAFVADFYLSKKQKQIAKNNPLDPGVHMARINNPRGSAKNLHAVPIQVLALTVAHSPQPRPSPGFHPISIPCLSGDSPQSPSGSIPSLSPVGSLRSPSGLHSPEIHIDDKSGRGFASSDLSPLHPIEEEEDGVMPSVKDPVPDPVEGADESDSSDDEDVQRYIQREVTSQGQNDEIMSEVDNPVEVDYESSVSQ